MASIRLSSLITRSLKGRAAAHRAMAKAALFADSSTRTRLKRYNSHIEKAQQLEARAQEAAKCSAGVCMSRVQRQIEKLDDLFGTISGLTHIIQEDLIRKASEGEKSIFDDHHIGCLLSAIDELANRGYGALDAIDHASQEQEVRS